MSPNEVLDLVQYHFDNCLKQDPKLLEFMHQRPTFIGSQKFYEQLLNILQEEYDPTPYCSGCGAMRKRQCDCGPIADNE